MEVGKMVSDLAIDEDGTVHGIFHHLTGYTGFSSAPEEQSGYYFPFHLTKSGDTMTFIKNGEKKKENIGWEADNVFRITAGDTFGVEVDGEPVVTFEFAKAAVFA